MHDKMTQQLAATAERLATAAEALDRVLGRLDAQQEALNAKVDRIVAAVDEQFTPEASERSTAQRQLEERVVELEKENQELKGQAARATRKTLSPMVTALLSKNGDSTDSLEAGALDKILQPLSIEQRIAVKAEMARAGMIE